MLGQFNTFDAIGVTCQELRRSEYPPTVDHVCLGGPASDCRGHAHGGIDTLRRSLCLLGRPQPLFEVPRQRLIPQNAHQLLQPSP